MNNSNGVPAKEGIEKLKTMATEINGCLFFTNIKVDDNTMCRYMGLEEVDENGNLWFLSDSNSTINNDIARDKNVQLFFTDPDRDRYLTVNGEATIITCPSQTPKLSSPFLKAWRKKEIEDPKISIISVNTKSAYYWDSSSGKSIRVYRIRLRERPNSTLKSTAPKDFKLFETSNN
jgi:general stress protein 26